MRPFLAWISPVGGGSGGAPPKPWGPINYPDQSLPGNQPYPDQGLPKPPPGIWGGGGVGDYIDAGFPGPQPGQPPKPWGPINYPDQSLPGNQPYPDQSLPWPQPHPSHPIVIPPDELPPQPVPPDKVVIVVFVPGVGYKLLVVPKPPGYNPPTGPSTEIPTPQG